MMVPERIQISNNLKKRTKMDRNISIRNKCNICLTVVISLFMLLSTTGCDDINSIHQKYYDRGEDIYTGVVDSIKAYAGYEKVLFEWELNSDPRITKTVIFWNNRADSVVVDVNRIQNTVMKMSYELDNIPEGNYIFEFITRDDEGDYSLAKEATVVVYGEEYSNSLRNRGVSSIIVQPDGSVLITWDKIASNEIQFVTVEYTINGETKTVCVENDETETVINGLKTGEDIYVSTSYQPTDALDLLVAPKRAYTIPKFSREISKSRFSIVELAGDNNTVLSGGRSLDKIWDGSTANPGILHTTENVPGFNFPHRFTFDMGVLAEIYRFHFWPRTDASPYTGHSPQYFEVWATDELKAASDDESYWKSEAWKSDWKMLKDCAIIKPSASDAQKIEWAAGWEYEVDEGIGRVRYIRLVIKESNWGGTNCVNIGEMTFWGNDL